MNENKLKLLVEYLKTLADLKGNYHNEIKRAIELIELELGIKSLNLHLNSDGIAIKTKTNKISI
jgi:hypothetical protein